MFQFAWARHIAEGFAVVGVRQPRRQGVLRVLSRLIYKLLRSAVSRSVPGGSARALAYPARIVAEYAVTAPALHDLGVLPFRQSQASLRTSDTLFILWSAPSINDLSSRQWTVIGRHDSIGFNSWALHDFVPNFYFAQHFPDQVTERLLSDDYLTQIVLLGDNIARAGLETAGLRSFLTRISPGRTWYLPELPVSEAFVGASAVEVLQFLRAIGLWEHGHVPRIAPKFRSTIGLAASFGYAMGYRSIVVCGSDPLTPGHFWDERQSGVAVRYRKYRDYFRSDLWTHESRLFSPNTVSDYLRAVNDDLRLHADGQVFSGDVAGGSYGLPSYWT